MLTRALKIEEKITTWRREFHMHPELGFREVRTAARVAEELSALGYRVRTGVGRTGVIGEIGHGTPIVALRADMDALPIQEQNDVPYASREHNVMHACGHDAHTAIALGAATLLADEWLGGTVRFLFQPSEEAADEEGYSGAFRMVEDAAMEGVTTIVALHVTPMVTTGEIAILEGPCFAGVDSFYVTIIGKGGHGAMPQTVVDPVYLASHAILAVQGIKSRRLHPTAAAVIGISTIHGGSAPNVVPDRVEMSGTIRFLDKTVRQQIHTELERSLQVVRALGGDFELRFELGGMPVVNDPAVARMVREVVTDLLGSKHLFSPENTEMGSEDFSVFTEMAPGAMFWLGCQIPGQVRLLHSPKMDIDERCLPIGAAVLAETALRLTRQT
jgi:amidohydrolase